jgi:luciferase family oxidoreductase group 1
VPPILSILDLIPVESGGSAHQALRDAAELAQLAERLGYHRIWYAEHHNLEGLASASPEILIEYIASRTTSIRVGSGGVMLPNHAPLRIAEAFRLLDALHPGRIDLGLGRAPGTDTRTTLALRRSRQAIVSDDYAEQLAELFAFEAGDFPPGHPFAGIRAIPVDAPLPPVTLLGSSDHSAFLAAETGLGFAFAAHINFPAAVPVLRAYREAFRPSGRFHAPWAILAVAVVIGETMEHARELAKIADLIRLRLRTGQLSGYPTLEEALAYPFTPPERAVIESMSMRSLVGDAAHVRDEMLALQEASGADELMITLLPAREDRIRAVEQLAAAFALPPRSEAPRL